MLEKPLDIGSNNELLHISERVNKKWRDSSHIVFVESLQKECTYKECYQLEIALNREIFNEVKKVADREIPEENYILFVDMADPGSMKHNNIKFIDRDRLEKVYEAETGSSDLGQDFQTANMRFCFGFSPSDKRFKTVKPFFEEMPKDLSKCVGVILSGSEAYIKDEDKIHRREMVKKVALFTDFVRSLKIPLFGICFGAQLIGSVWHAEVGWINEAVHDTEESGLVSLKKTNKGKSEDSPISGLPDTFFVHANHRQEIKAEHMPQEFEILAQSDTSQVQILHSRECDTVLAVQNHIECGDTRADILKDMFNKENKDPQIFQGESSKARRILCPYFLGVAGKYAKSLN